MNRRHRLSRINKGLAAPERAALCVRATLDRIPEDPLIRETMPLEQVEDFNRYLALANGVLHVLPYAFCLAKDVECSLLRLNFLCQVSTEEADGGIADRVRRDFGELWSALLAYELFAEEVIAQFGDPVVVPRAMGDAIARARRLLLELQAAVEPLIGELEVPAMDTGLLGSLRRGAQRDARAYL